MIPLLTALFAFPEDFITSSTAYLADTLEAVKIPFYLVFGICLMMWLVNWLLGLVGRRTRARRA